MRPTTTGRGASPQCVCRSGRSHELHSTDDPCPGQGRPDPWRRVRRRRGAGSRGGRGSGGRQAGAKGGGSARRRWAKRLGLTALVGLALGVVTFGVAYALIDTPEPNDLVNAQTSIVYYADGKTEMDRISVDGGNRHSVPLKQVPKAVQEAHLAAEDRDFYENSGISPTGIARAVWVGLRGGATQGGSTITQQYVKNYFLTQDQTLTRKGREIIISIKIAKQQGKDEILQNYLNTIYYGRGAYGIQTASKAYFGKDVSKLTASEGALLASVIRGPSFYDPALGEEQKANAKERWVYVMDGMVSQGWITQAERDKAVFPAKSLVKYAPDRGVGGTTGYIVDAGPRGAAHQAQAHRRRHRQGRLPDRHDDRQEGPGRRRQGRQGAHAHGQGSQGPARRPHLDQAR